MPSFVNMVLLRKKDDSPIGDVARDVFMDSRINKRWGYDKLCAHLREAGAIPIVLDILKEYRESLVNRAQTRVALNA